MAKLSGMKEIVGYVGRSEPTILKMIRTLNFPAKKIFGGWGSHTELIDEWWKKYVTDNKDETEGE